MAMRRCEKRMLLAEPRAPRTVSRSGEREAAPRWAGHRDDVSVTVEKALELIGTGDSVQDAVTEALDRARMTLEGITGFEVVRISGTVDDATTEYRVELRVWFVLRERMHG
jgi:flavin-binding protein dodecin